MPAPDPPWKIRTRPCPFYSSGRCLFASACNFQHVIRSSLTAPEDTPQEKSKVWTTREYFEDRPQQNWVDSDNDQEEGGDEDGEDTINWSKRSSYAPSSVDRRSWSSRSSLSCTETGTVRGRPLSFIIPNLSSGDSLNDDTLVDTTNSAEPEDEGELEERRMSIRFSDPHFQTTPFDLKAFRTSAISVKQRRRSQVPTTLSTYVDPPSPPPSIPQLDAQEVQVNGDLTHTWSGDSDGASSRRTSLLSSDPGSPSSEYQELEIVSRQSPRRGEFQLALPEASSLIATRTGQEDLLVNTRDPDSDSRASQLAPELERKQTFNTLRPPSLIFEHDQHDHFDATPSPNHSLTDSHYDQLPRFIPTAPLTLEPPTPSTEESPFQARQRFHRAFALVTKELRERVKHFREPETPSLGGSFQRADENGDGCELEVVSVGSASGIVPSRSGAAGNNAREEQGLGYLTSTAPKSESPLVYEAAEGPSMDRDTAPEVVAAYGKTSPPWLKPLRLSTVFPGGRGPLIFQPPQVPQQIPQPYPHLRSRSQPQMRPQTQTRSQPPSPLSAVESPRRSVTSSDGRSLSSRRSTRSLAAAGVDHGLVFAPPRKSPDMELPPVPPLPENIALPPSSFTPSMYISPSVAPVLANGAPSRPLPPQMVEELYPPQSTDAPSPNLLPWESHWPRRPSIASSVFSGSMVPPSSRGSSMFQFHVHGRNDTNSTNLSVPPTPDVPRVSPVPFVPSGVVRTRGPTSRSHSIASSKSNPRIVSPRQPSASPVLSTSTPSQAHRSRPSSIKYSPSAPSFHSATPSVQTSVKHPRLFFAIAASEPEEVARLLQTGEADANETVGPEDMHALEFAVESLKDGNEGDMSKKEEIVTTLLSYGADPSAVKNEGNAYVKYFLDKATNSPVIPEEVKSQNAVEEAPLARARFVLVGQEYGVRDLMRSYRAHVRLAKYLADDETELPFVALLTGPSGHGKTHLATRIGGLLGTTSYSVNMTLVRSQREFWETASSRPDEAAQFSSLREYLIAHDSKPGVIVVDELEKVHDKAYLQALLVPWETGRVQGISGHPSRCVDMSKIVWICTSNVASQDIVKHSREGPRTQQWFEELRLIARIQLGDELGASLLARVSAVIPFVTFTDEERLAISSQALSGLKRNLAKADAEQLHKVTNWEGVVARAAKEYVEPEGARSIRRGIVKWTDVVLRGERLS